MTKKNQQSVYDQVIQNLPSFKHCSELKRNVLYLTIQYLIKNENIKFINQWISKLQGRLDKDINYVIDDITHGIKQLKKHRNVWLDHQINKIVIDVLNANRFFNCDRTFKYENSKYRLQRKIMDDLCENFNYISNNMNNYKNKHMCEGVASYIASNKSYLKKLFSDVKIRNDPIFNFDSKCTIDYIENSITLIKCNNETNAPQALQGDSKVKLEDDVSEAALAAVEANQLDDPDPGEMAQFFIEDDTPFYLRPTNIGTAAIGIPLLSLIIYKVKHKYTNKREKTLGLLKIFTLLTYRCVIIASVYF
ncbi:Pv-fam-c protein [Plasmodium vivax Mauritania I]|uniref:Pv-fam-c protein n=1 Tax=Plasmodium vivax Mauritania I TaxID=1035515 RepID=A0A0J9W4Q8_PLAVI|nr:Pv-fam-c protein [Plasmodium vivax Mauritania I]